MPEQGNPDNGGYDSQSESIPPLIKTYIDEQIKNANPAEQEPRKKKWKNSWRSAGPITKGTFILTAAVAFATIGYAIIAARQLGEMKRTNQITQAALDRANKNSLDSSNQFQVQLHHFDDGLGRTGLLATHAGEQADAANKLATTTAKQFDYYQRLIASQGAAISVAPYSVDGPITFEPYGDGRTGMNVFLALGLTNNGALPATNVGMRYELYFGHANQEIFTEPARRQKQLCNKPAPKPFLPPLTILQGHTAPMYIQGGWNVPKEDLLHWPNTTDVTVTPIIVGCIDYHSGAMAQPHQTGFIFEVEQSSGSMIRFPIDVPADKVRVKKYAFSQGDSY